MSEESEKLPHGWMWASLGEIAIVIRGVTYEKADARDTPQSGLLPILRATNIGERLSLTDLVYVPTKYVKEEQLLRAGDIVIAASSGSRQIVGKAAQLTSPWAGSFGAFCFALRPSPDLDARYLALFLRTTQYRNRISSLSAGIGINNLRTEHLRSAPIPLAPRPEQVRVVAEVELQLSRLEAATAALQRVKGNLQRYRTTLLKSACEGRLVPTEAELARAEGREYETATEFLRRVGLTEEINTGGYPNLPQGWAWTLLGSHLAKIEAGKNFKCEERPPRLDEVGVVKISAVTWGRFNEHESKTCVDPSQVRTESLIKGGDFLFSRANTLQLVGACVIVDRVTTKLMLSDKILRFQLKAVQPEWILHTLRSPHGRKEIESLATGNQESMRNIGQERIRKILIPLPPPEETTRILLEIERQLSVIGEFEKAIITNLQRADRLRQTILQQAFQGRLVPQDPNDEAASILLERIRQAKAANQSEPRAKRKKAVSAAPPATQPSPAPVAKPSPPAEPEPEPLELDFLDFPREEQMEVVWDTLFGSGALEKDEAIRTAAEGLRDQGFARFKRLRQDGPLYREITAAIEKGVREGWLDRPRRGSVRAVRRDPKEYAIEDWQRCLLAVIGPEPADIEATLRAAAEWARETLGLEFVRLREDGTVLTGLREALEETVREKRVVRRRGRVWLG